MAESGVVSGAGTHEVAEPVIVFRSSDPVECASIASALNEAGVQAWVYDDPALHIPYWSRWLEVSLGRASCVSVPARVQQHALGVIAGLRPRAFPVQRRQAFEPLHGFGYRAPALGRVIAWLIVAAFALGFVFALVRLWRGQPF